MALENPALANNAALNGATKAATTTYTAEQLNAMYNQPSVEPPHERVAPREGGMTYDDVIIRTAVSLAFVVGFAVVGWMFPGVALPAMFVGLVLGIINSFKKQPSVPLILAYSVAEGLFIGGLSRIVEYQAPGIAMQAAIATMVVFGVVLALFASGKVRASAKATKIFMIAIISYAVFSLVNVVLQLTGVVTDPWGLATSVTLFGIPLGLIIGVVAILLASYSLVMDFDYAKKGVEAGIDRKYAWSVAFGLTVTLIWLYVEFLRLISILRNN